MKKQALVLIHGIGDQVPMDTLRGFVDAVWTTDADLHPADQAVQPWSKPDEMSGDFELRRLTTGKNRNDKRTDFFEFYWAHLMEGTTLSHVRAWAMMLLFRWPWRVPPQLRALWFILVVLVALLVMGLLVGLNQVVSFFGIPHWMVKAGWCCWLVLGPLIIWLLNGVVGDAARYLHVAPPNIEVRRRIREAGIQLLQKLHTSGQYDRIIVVGHSLGSVIGYDILTHLWPRYHDAHVAAAGNPSSFTALQKLEAIARQAQTGGIDLDQYPAAQSAYLEELQCQKNQWLVTDFVTLGSPLTHATMLMARNADEFNSKKAQREFPTCPPFLETVKGQSRFSFEKQGMWVPHHAAVFAPTRWTNLYFPCRWTLWGDVVGGPLSPSFGAGVRDVAVSTNIWGGLFSHTRYWDQQAGAIEAALHIQGLRKAVRM